ncbi:MAG: hypothetical protein ABEJ93_05135 [Candidatus Nanohalobium sp.]
MSVRSIGRDLKRIVFWSVLTAAMLSFLGSQSFFSFGLLQIGAAALFVAIALIFCLYIDREIVWVNEWKQEALNDSMTWAFLGLMPIAIITGNIEALSFSGKEFAAAGFYLFMMAFLVKNLYKAYSDRK